MRPWLFYDVVAYVYYTYFDLLDEATGVAMTTRMMATTRFGVAKLVEWGWTAVVLPNRERWGFDP